MNEYFYNKTKRPVRLLRAEPFHWNTSIFFYELHFNFLIRSITQRPKRIQD
ncbi:hypothetical protein [Paenibacillus glucanolyticus]|uniref:hypothetical protein n=1 Tax=Paenibacillus glucanolyticus TaxID=59843 RepID=UPI0015C350EA|nr:hypothetical protein [Paenibacillus glucanolyticus]